MGVVTEGKGRHPGAGLEEVKEVMSCGAVLG